MAAMTTDVHKLGKMTQQYVIMSGIEYQLNAPHWVNGMLVPNKCVLSMANKY